METQLQNKKGLDPIDITFIVFLCMVLIALIIFVIYLIIFHLFVPIHVANDFKQHFVPPEGWHVSEVDWFIIDKYDKNSYEIYVKIRNDKENWCWSNDFVNYNMKTKEIHSDFSIENDFAKRFGYKGVC